MNTSGLLEIKTRPGDVIVLSRWDNGVLKHFQSINHDDNIGPLSLPAGRYSYIILAGHGSHTVNDG